HLGDGRLGLPVHNRLHRPLPAAFQFSRRSNWSAHTGLYAANGRREHFPPGIQYYVYASTPGSSTPLYRQQTSGTSGPGGGPTPVAIGTNYTITSVATTGSQTNPTNATNPEI